MPSKNQVNQKEVLKDLENKISPILVVNNSSLKPYVELFDYAPENIYQQPLGSLVGFFEIKEYSEDSAYVVNFLTSVLKKEYYINPKRPVTESLDSALHKVNLALSELAKHGNVEWLGKLNATICVLEKNNAHFSVSGNAKIFLYRNTTLTDISEDLAADPSQPHPLKTFVNVSSGRLEKNDRLLITSDDIFHIFSTIELKKNLQRFEGEKFIQFLKTALSNQMEMIATMVVEMQESQVKAPTKAKKKTPAPANAFSQTAFAEVATTVADAVEKGYEVINTPEAEAEYTDQKTGHIYVQGEATEPVENPKMALLVESAKEKIGEAWYVTKNETRRKFNVYKKQISRKLEQRKIEKERLAKEREEELERIHQEEEILRIENEKRMAEEEEAQRILFEKQELERKENEALALQQSILMEKQLEEQRIQEEKEAAKKTSPAKKIIPKIEDEYPTEEQAEQDGRELSFQEKLQLAVKQQEQLQQRQAVIDLRTPQKTPNQKIEDFFKEKVQPEENEIENEELAVPVHQQAELDAIKKQQRIENFRKNFQQASTKTRQLSANMLAIAKKKTATLIAKNTSSQQNQAHVLPVFSKIKTDFGKFSAKQKIYTFIILSVIFIVPFFIARFLNKPKVPVTNQLPEKTLTQADILSGEKNIKTGLEAQSVISNSNLNSSVIMTNFGLIAFTKNSVLVIDEAKKSKEFQMPSGEGSISKATYMNDLSMILIITDQNKVVSFSPISQKFTENNINLSGKAVSEFFGTYLTYMYVLDSEAGQVYRYPRADGGFGEKTDWLKSQAQLGKVASMAIDESLWVADGKQLTKYFKGSPEQFRLESSATSINYDLVHTNLDSTYLYVLDKLNARIVAFSKDNGNIIAQYHSEKLSGATSFTIDEKNKTAYAVTSSELISVSIQ